MLQHGVQCQPSCFTIIVINALSFSFFACPYDLRLTVYQVLLHFGRKKFCTHDWGLRPSRISLPVFV